MVKRRRYGKTYCKFFEWDENEQELRCKYSLDENSDLSEALQVFYSAGGYEFFNVVNPKYYATNWLAFMSKLYCEIEEQKYKSSEKRFTIPLNEEQKIALLKRGVPRIFVEDI